jgi:hypothetical protein
MPLVVKASIIAARYSFRLAPTVVFGRKSCTEALLVDNVMVQPQEPALLLGHRVVAPAQVNEHARQNAEPKEPEHAVGDDFPRRCVVGGGPSLKLHLHPWVRRSPLANERTGGEKKENELKRSEEEN